jgi:hypothetical protein
MELKWRKVERCGELNPSLLNLVIIFPKPLYPNPQTFIAPNLQTPYPDVLLSLYIGEIRMKLVLINTPKIY